MIAQTLLSKDVGISTVRSIFRATDNMSVIGVFTGDIPNVDNILPILGTSGASPTCASVCSALGLKAGNLLSALTLPALNYIYLSQGELVQLSLLTALLPGVADGVPTYAVVRQAAGAVTMTSTDQTTLFNGLATSSYACNNLIILTIGDEKSNADIQILGGKIVKGVSYSMTDLLISN